MFRRNYFTMRVVRHWNKFPRVAVDVPFLEMFKAKLIWKLSLPMAGMLELGGLTSPPNLDQFIILRYRKMTYKSDQPHVISSEPTDFCGSVIFTMHFRVNKRE